MTHVAAQRLAIAAFVGTLVAAGALAAPAFGVQRASDIQQRLLERRAATPVTLGVFTPAAADPRLAALFARSGLYDGGLRFTPAETHRVGRTVTVAVRSPAGRSSALTSTDHAPTTGGAAPTAYAMGAAIGWKRFAVSGDLSHADLAAPAAPREPDLGAVGTLSAHLNSTADQPITDLPRLVQQSPSYSIDRGGAYRLTHNVDVTAGARARLDRDRLQRPDENQRRDSQAVYVGTAFKF